MRAISLYAFDAAQRLAPYHAVSVNAEACILPIKARDSIASLRMVFTMRLAWDRSAISRRRKRADSRRYGDVRCAGQAKATSTQRGFFRCSSSTVDDERTNRAS